jgi:hypothetical protein
MKADKKCGNCEWWRKAIVTPNEKRYCFAVEPYEGDVMPCGENCVCKRWSANLDGAACEKCVYWFKDQKCHRRSPRALLTKETWNDDWAKTSDADLCGDFIPGAV